MRHLRIGCAIAALVAPVALHAQDTASSIRGQVTNDAGTGIANAEVVVVHTPSGTRSTLTTDASGNFNASGLRLGGPYSVAVTAAGFDPVSETVENLVAGTPQRLTVILAEVGQTITVTAGRQRSSISIASGPATVLTAEDIRGISSVNRDIRNLVVRNPLVSLDPTNGQGAISIAGTNNRFNRFSVDGVQFGDPFGLEAGGLATSRGPVPLDAISELTVEVAPVDIQQGQFTGGAINAQLLSGSNTFTATGFYSYSGDSLRGKTTSGTRFDAPFSSNNFGLQVTGPIIKDKLFFAATWERLRNRTPTAVQPSNLGISDAQIETVNAIADRVYQYDTLGVADNVSEVDDKVVAKVDWNIADGHRASFTYIYAKGSALAGQTGLNQIGATNPTLALLSNNYDQGAINHYGVIQFNDQWTDSFSTQVRASYNDYVRLQVPFGGRDFGQFQVCNRTGATIGTPTVATQICPPGLSRIAFGPDNSRQANELSVKSLSFEFQAQLKMNDHTVKFIAERRGQDVNNLFAQNVSGVFRFDSLTDLENRRANQLVFSQPLRGDIDTVAAIFQNNFYTFGLQDTWNPNDDLTVTAGFRWDIYDAPDRPVFNQDFQNRYGFPNNSTLNGRTLFQPRVAAQWRASDRLTVRATAGLFGGGGPLVWISNSYSNPGPLLGTATVTRTATGAFTVAGLSPALSTADQQTIGAAALNNVSGGPGIPQALRNALIAGGAGASNVNALDPNFRIPSTWRVTGTVDYEADLGFLGDEWNLGGDVIWSRVRDALTYVDLRSVPNTVQALLPDGRPRYQSLVGGATSPNQDLLLTNTDLGYSWNIVARFDKRWDNGVFLNGAYTFQRAKDVNPLTSSTANSNYGNAASSDPNQSAYGTSNYQIDNQYRLNVGIDKEIFGNNNTRIELFFVSRSGQPFSYNFTDLTPQRSGVFGTTGTNTRYLLYVPNVASATADPRVTYAAGFDFAGFQNFVQNGDLAKLQGQIAPKNIGRAPRFNKLDLSVRQELPFVFGGKLEAFADMENLLNFINSDWGSLRQVPFPYFGEAVTVTCAGTTSTAAPCTQFVYAQRQAGSFNPPPQPPQIAGLWTLRVGARFRF